MYYIDLNTLVCCFASSSTIFINVLNSSSNEMLNFSSLSFVDPYVFGNLKRSSVTTEAQITLLSVFLVAKPQILQQKSNLLQGYWITHRNNRKAGEKGWERAGIEVDLGIHVAETSQRSLQGPTAGMSEIQFFFFFKHCFLFY